MTSWADAIRVSHPDRLAGEAVIAVACSDVLFTDVMDVALDGSRRRYVRVRLVGPGEYGYTYVGRDGSERPLTRDAAVELLAAAVETGE